VPKVHFHCLASGSWIEAEAESNELLTQVAYRAGVTIQQTCGGSPSCTDCRIRVLEGLDALSPQEGAEKRLMGNVFHITRERLSCQARVLADVRVEVPDPASFRRNKLQRK
jgi:ferredoxin